MRTEYLEDHLEKLKSFRTIVEVSSFSRASSHLGLSQSSLSHSIKILEDILQSKLLDRQARGVSLTEAGRVLYEFSKRLQVDVKNSETRIRAPNETYSGHLFVATHETLAVHIWPGFLRTLKKKYPLLQVSLMSGRVDSIVEGLLNRDYHLSLTVETLPHPKLERVSMYTGNIELFAGPRAACEFFPQLRKDRLTLKDIEGIPIVTDKDSHVKQGLPMTRYLAGLGINVSSTYEFNSFEAAIRFAAQGLGIAVAPIRNAQEALKQKMIRRIQVGGRRQVPGEYSVGVTYRKDADGLCLIKCLIEELKAFTKT